MRLSLVHLLVILLVAVFAMGAPAPAQADCATCQDCSVDAPANKEAPCPETGLACQIAPSCGSQAQKMPAQAFIVGALASGKAAFSAAADAAAKPAFTKPETSPPRL